MFSRILFSTIAAATLLTAAPALAAEGSSSKQSCSCCSDGSIHNADHMLRESQRAPAVLTGRLAVNPDPFLRNQNSSDPFIRNNSFGG